MAMVKKSFFLHAQVILTDLQGAGLANNMEDETLGFHLNIAKATQDCFQVSFFL